MYRKLMEKLMALEQQPLPLDCCSTWLQIVIPQQVRIGSE